MRVTLLEEPLRPFDCAKEPKDQSDGYEDNANRGNQRWTMNAGAIVASGRGNIDAFTNVISSERVPTGTITSELIEKATAAIPIALINIKLIITIDMPTIEEKILAPIGRVRARLRNLRTKIAKRNR